MRRLGSRIAPIVVVGLALFAGSAHAEPSGAEKETARGMMHDGYVRAQSGDLEAALKAYRGADAIMKVPTTGVAVVRTLAAMGRLLEARERALAVVRSPVAPDESEAFA